MKAEQLRKSILQLAIQGKLVPQDPNDEPASVLLERIHVEKQRLIKEGKIKKDKNDSVIFKGDDNRYYEKVGSEVKDITDDLPFEIPDSWVWCHLGNFVLAAFSGKSPKYSKEPTPHKIVGQQANQWDGLDLRFVKYATEEFAENMPSSYYLQDGDVLLNTLGNGTLGRSSYYRKTTSSEFLLTDGHLFVFRTLDRAISYYLKIYLKDKYDEIVKSANGSTNQTFLSLGKTLQWFVPVPPLAEQRRIVAEIEKFEPLIAEYAKLEEQATKLDDEIYGKLKKSILQYAIQGKLVPQDPNDEPASVLLERIRAEKKAKLGKKYVESYIYKGDDNCYYEHIAGRAQDELVEMSFDIPDTWEWSRIKYVADTQTGTTPSTSDKGNFGDYIPFVKPGDIVNGQIIYNREMLSKQGLSNGRLIPSNSIIMVCIGGSTGKCALTDRDISCNQQINVASPYKWVLPQYLYFFMMSDHFYKTVRANATGTATPIINRSTWENIVISIPPLAEQKRIAAKINEMFAML